MDIKAVSPDLNIGIEQDRRRVKTLNPGFEPDAKTRSSARKVAREFEAMFTGMMLKSMRSTSGPDKLTGGGRGEEVFQSLLDQEYAIAISQQGNMGLAQTIEKQLLEDARRQAASAARRNATDKP
jgi:peptidoglycan hydrolase FlgJ